MGAESVADLEGFEEAFVQAVGADLKPIPRKRLLDRVTAAAKTGAGGASSPPSTRTDPEDKFVARTLILGQAIEATQQLRQTLGLSDEVFADKLALGEKAIEMEFDKYGSEEDNANMRYVLHCKALAKETLPNHLVEQIKNRKYHGGILNEGELDEGHDGMDLSDFVKHEKSQIANLTRCETASLRLYTSSSYPCFNRFLREQTQPHPFAMSVYHLAEGIKKMRGVAARLNPEEWTKPVELWRGMADMKLDTEEFMKAGGSERALMSTSRSKGVAQQYAASRCPLLFKYITRALGRGVSIDYLSIYPKEREYLYPPLTYLTPEKTYTEDGYTVVEVTPMMN